MDNTTNTNYDEISLRELILTMWKGKVIIAIVTAIAVLIAAIYSYVILDNTYEADTAFLVSPIKVANANTGADSSLYADIDNKLALNVENYASFFESTDYLEKVADTLQLEDEDGNTLDAKQIAGKINVTTDDAKSTIAVTVTDKDPAQAHLIANTLHTVLIDHVNAHAKENIKEYLTSIDYNLELARTDLEAKREELNSFRAENGNIELLTDEIASLKEIINTINSSLITLEADIDADIASLDTVIEQLRKDGITDVGTAEIISEIKQAASSSTEEDEPGSTDPEFSLQTSLDMNNSQIANSVRMLELNRLQLRLLNNFNRQQTYTEQLVEVEAQFQQKQQDYLELNPRYTAVKNEYDIVASTYDAYLQRKTAAQSIDTLDVANPHITQVVRPELPESPSGPRRALNMAIALVLGLMLGVFIVFFREYWKNSGKVE